MAIGPGARLRQYEVLSSLGAGGMGEVWRARDTTLGREVAIKILPEEFSKDPDRLARFEREARTLASLNHPGIATLYELAEHDGVRFLAMELVKGETLAARILRGAIPIDEALRLFHQIAEALEEAHENAVVHRDLKPANIVITPDGRAKVLDFGLAKALEGAPTESTSESPTITKDTALGVILGTAPYMSPEQARGLSVDRRADIWAFGCCLYEALTGKLTFSGKTVSDTIAAILKQEPDWSTLPTDTPANVRKVLTRCLTKDIKQRFQHIGDVRIELQHVNDEPAETEASSQRPGRAILPALAALLAGALAMWLLRPLPEPEPVVHLEMTTEELNFYFHPALSMSPDGNVLAYNPARHPPMLRYMDGSFHAVVPGLDGGGVPFFSPDGEWIGFFQAGVLKKVPLTGGTPISLCEARGQGPFAASWGDDGTIVLNYNPGGLKRVSANGGDVQELTRPNLEDGEVSHQFPDVLPGGKAVLFTAHGSGHIQGAMGLHVYESGETRILGPGTTPRYAESGHIVFYRDGSLHAMPFDLETLTVRGNAVPVIENVYAFPATAIAQFDVSPAGTLVYIPWSPEDVEKNLVWVDRFGEVQSKRTYRRDVGYPRFSPDGEQFLVTITDRLERTIWLSDVSRDTFSPLTQYQSDFGEWAPDGTVAFGRMGNGPYWISLDTPDAGESLSGPGLIPSSWSPNGDVLALTEIHPETSLNIWTVSVDGDREPQPFETGEGWQSSPEFSPDGRYIAYVTDESGSMQVYVRPFPGPGRRVQVSTDVAILPLWHPNGRELFYVGRPSGGDRRGLVSVDVTTSPSFEILSEPREVLPNEYEWRKGPTAFRNFDISPDGETFLLVESVREFRPTTVKVVLNWFSELERLVPTQ